MISLALVVSNGHASALGLSGLLVTSAEACDVCLTNRAVITAPGRGEVNPSDLKPRSAEDSAESKLHTLSFPRQPPLPSHKLTLTLTHVP